MQKLKNHQSSVLKYIPLDFVKWMYPIFSDPRHAEKYLSEKIKEEINIEKIEASFAGHALVTTFRYYISPPICLKQENVNEITVKVATEWVDVFENEFNILNYLNKNNLLKPREFLIPQPLFIDKKINSMGRTIVAGKDFFTYTTEKKFIDGKIIEKMLGFLYYLNGLNTDKIALNCTEFFQRKLSELKWGLMPLLRYFKWSKENHIEQAFDQKKLLKSASEIGKRMEEIAKEKGEMTLIHGDFHPKNIIIRDNQIGIIDFDESGIFVPGYDLANLLLQLDNQFDGILSRREILNGKKKILDFYFQKRKKDDLMNINLFQADVAMRTILILIRDIITRKALFTGNIQSNNNEEKMAKINLLLEKIQRCLINKEVDL